MTKNLIATVLILCLMSCADANKKQTVKSGDADTSKKIETSKNSRESTSKAVPVLDSATMMANWQAYMTPGEMHEMLKSWNGNWKQETSTWEYPGAAPQLSKGTSVNEMILGGRYQKSTSTGTMMGKPFQGISTTSYDNAKKSFKMMWIDNVGTGMAIMEGPWDMMSKSMSLAGTMVDPSSSDGREMPIRQVYKVEDDKHHVMQMFMAGEDGKEFMMMEMKLTKM